MSEPHPHRRAALAALLSFVFPGLGQAYAGQRRLAAILALPIFVLIGSALGTVLLSGRGLGNLLLSTTFLSVVLVVDIALLAWRLVAIGQAGFFVAAPARPPQATPRLEGARVPLPGSRAGRIGFVVLLLIVTVGMHAWAGLVIGRLDSTLGTVFSGGSHVTRGPEQGTGQDAPLNLPEYAWNGTERISFLLLGIDSGPGRDEALTDTMLVLSVDPVAKTAVMVSVPRDTALMPLADTDVYPDALYPYKINQLTTEASQNAAAWCPDMPASDAALCGIRTLERSISLYLGIPIQYYAQVDLRGFAQLIDAVGGLTLCLPGRMVDVEYTGPGVTGMGIELPAGCSHYDGATALAYARSRKGYIELPDGTREQQDDFKRADRQQQVLLELQREIARVDLVFELPPLLDAIAQTVTTDFPRDKAGDLASLAQLVSGQSVQRVVLGLPDYVNPPAQPLVNYVLTPKLDAVRAKMVELFGADLQGWYLNGEAPPAG